MTKKNCMPLLALCLLAACNSNTGSLDVQTNTDSHHKTPYFTLSLPKGWSQTKLQGIDSYVGYFQNGTDTLWFDYSFTGTSNPVGQFTKPLYLEETEINNCQAWIVKEKTLEGIWLSAYIRNKNETATTRLYTFNPSDDRKFINLFKTHRFKND